MARGELGGPFVKLLVIFSPSLAMFGNRWVLRGVATGLIVGTVAFGYAMARFVSQANLIVQVVVAALMIFLIGQPTIVLYRVALKRTRATFTRRFARWSPEEIWTFSALIVIGPAIGLATIATILVSRDIVSAVKAGGTEVIAPSDPDLARKVFDVFWWNLADAVPIVKIPETINWEPEIKLGLGGALLGLLFKLALIPPMVQLAGELLKNPVRTTRGTGPRSAQAQPAGRPARPGGLTDDGDVVARVTRRFCAAARDSSGLGRREARLGTLAIAK